MIPLLVHSALSTVALLDSIGGSDSCSWIDINTLSKTIIEIGDVAEFGGEVIGNILGLHPRPMSWKWGFLPALKNAGLEFGVVSWEIWMEGLKDSERNVEKNPSRKLHGF